MRLAIILLTCLSAGLIHTATAQTTEPKVDVRALIDSIDKALFRTYIFPEKSKLMSGHLRTQLKKGAYRGITDPKLLAEKIEADIREVHRDGHLRMHYDPNFGKMLAARKSAGPPPPDTTAVVREKRDNFGFRKVEILNGNIGYVQFAGFSGMIAEAKPIISAAFRFLSNTDAIIIDLRKNGGGSPWMVKQISSYFYSERTRLNDIYDRRVNKTMDFWAEPAEAENMSLKMPLYILTSRHTFSAAEDFTYAMQVNKRAVIVGDTTGGGAHPTGPVAIGQDFVMDIPFARSINHITQTDWEGTGVRPDIPVDAETALVKAQEAILDARFAKTTGDGQKQQLTWLKNALRATESYGDRFTEALLKSYEGTYGRFQVYVKDNALYLDDFVGRTFRLKPISDAHFMGDDWFQVEFVSNGSTFTQMKMSGKPGWIDVLDRK